MNGDPRVCGRFAPSPTGPLHLGSLVAALGSFLDARARGGRWLVRIDDLDPPREQPGAADAILRALEAHGLHWDGPVLYQSTRGEAYRAALERLREDALAYRCACTRREVGRGPYRGTCRDGPPPGRRARSLRVTCAGAEVRFVDRIRGRRSHALEDEYGDFVVRRADGLVAYHLAVTVDDAWQGITDVVRGGDLLEATAPQVYLQQCLALPTPAYAHLPVAVDAHGRKLSKQNRAPALDPSRAAGNLAEALALLGQAPPPALHGAGAGDVLGWALAHWRLERVPAPPARAGSP